MWRAANELEEARAEFCTKIDTSINDSKSCKSDTNGNVFGG